MPDKAILYYICSKNLVYSLVGGLIPWSSEGSGWLILFFFLWDFKPLTSFSSVSNSTTGDHALKAMDGCQNPALY